MSSRPICFTRRKMLEIMLARCRGAMEDCFSLDPHNSILGTRIAAYEAGQSLMKTSLMLLDALEPPDQPAFVHRIVVERTSSSDSDGPLRATPPTPKKRKTIPRVPKPREPQD